MASGPGKGSEDSGYWTGMGAGHGGHGGHGVCPSVTIFFCRGRGYRTTPGGWFAGIAGLLVRHSTSGTVGIADHP